MNTTFKMIFVAILLFMVSCRNDKPGVITGTWHTVNIADKTGEQVSDELFFGQDGHYTMKVYKQKNVLLEQWSGKYTYDSMAKTINLEQEGKISTMKVLVLKWNRMQVEVGSGVILAMERVGE